MEQILPQKLLINFSMLGSIFGKVAVDRIMMGGGGGGHVHLFCYVENSSFPSLSNFSVK